MSNGTFMPDADEAAVHVPAENTVAERELLTAPVGDGPHLGTRLDADQLARTPSVLWRVLLVRTRPVGRTLPGAHHHCDVT